MDNQSLITLRLSAGAGKTVPFEAFALAIPAWQRILDEFVAEYSEVKEAHWQISHLQIGSTEVGVVPRDYPASGDYQPFSGVGAAVIQATNEIELGADPYDVLPSKAVAHFRQLTRAFEDKVVSITFQTPQAVSEITPVIIHTRLEEVRPLPSRGTLAGILQGVFFGEKKPYFLLRSSRYDRHVKGYFDLDTQSDTVIEVLRLPVEVRGRLWRGQDGRVQRIDQIRTIQPVPEQGELPAIRSLIGAVPDIADGLSSDAWLRRQRSGN